MKAVRFGLLGLVFAVPPLSAAAVGLSLRWGLIPGWSFYPLAVASVLLYALLVFRFPVKEIR